jgi:hypothetical protein
MRNATTEKDTVKPSRKVRASMALAAFGSVVLMTGCGADGPAFSEFLGPLGQLFDLLGA